MRSWLAITGILCSIMILPTISSSAQSAPFVEATVDKATPYVGQSITYTVRLYRTADLSNIVFQQPPFRGFGQSDLPPLNREIVETRNGVSYTVTEQQYVLYPLQAGNQTITPYQITVPETPFQSGGSYQTDPLSINVQSLPDDAPATFKNAVGQYTIEADLTPSTVAAGEPATLTINITGSGNLDQLLSPPIAPPEAWQLIEQAPSYQRDSATFGSKEFRWIVIPSESATLPAIAFSFFNPQTKTYQTRRTAPLTLTVTGSTANTTNNTATTAMTPSANTAATQSMARPPEPFPLKSQFSATRAMPPAGFWFLWGIPPFLVLILWALRQTPSVSISLPTRSSVRRSRALQTAIQRLESAVALPPNEAYAHIGQTILHYLSQRSGQTISYENISNAVNHLPPKIQRAIRACLQTASSGQYAPVNETDVQTLLRRTRAVLSAADERWSDAR